MREQAGQILKVACLVLAALLLYQFVQVARRVNPLSHVTIPALPKLASDTNAPDSGNGMTNSSQVATAKGTNAPGGEAGTNSVAGKIKKEKGTNLVSGDLAKSGATNSTGSLIPAAGTKEKIAAHNDEASASTNTSAQISAKQTENSETNLSPPVASAANTTTNLQAESDTNTLPTTLGTNVLLMSAVAATNISTLSVAGETNLATMVSPGTNIASSTTNGPQPATLGGQIFYPAPQAATTLRPPNRKGKEPIPPRRPQWPWAG